MLKMRLQRVGRRNNPLFRAIVIEGSEGPRSGKAVEVLGSYNPHTNAKEINTERASYWISKGAQPSGTMHNILVDLEVIKADKINVLPHKSPVVKESAEEDGGKDKPEEAKAEDSGEDEDTAKEAKEREEASAEEEKDEVAQASEDGETSADKDEKEEVKESDEGESADEGDAQEAESEEAEEAQEDKKEGEK